MSGIHLESVTILAEVYTELGRYRTDVAEELKKAQVAAQRALSVLDDYERGARKALSGLEEAMAAIRRHGDHTRDATYTLRRQIDETNERLRRCHQHRARVQEAIKELERQRIALTNHLEKELPQSQALLMRLRAHVEQYSS